MERRLAAILVADVVNYTRMMGEDETGTLAALNNLRERLFQPQIDDRNGKIIKRMGDGWIVEFSTASDAVKCATAIQERLTEQAVIQLRIGVHVGEVIFQSDDIFGDGINTASRLEALAIPGQVLISDIVHHTLDGKSAEKFTGGEAHELKNVARPVKVWRWPMGSDINEAAAQVGAIEKPSIAVLPFDNLSSDPEQEFFADGIVEDLITALSRFPWLFVISRKSSFSYKGEQIPLKQLASELGVQYVVEGSVRSSPTRLRVAVQLIDADKDDHVWAENYDRPTGDLFDLQDEIVQSITGVLVPALSGAERVRSLRNKRPDLNAWMAFQRGLAHFYLPYSDEDHAEARRFFDQAVELDQSFTDGHAMIALMGVYAFDSGQSSYTASPAEILDEAERAARTALQCDDGNALAHLVIGRVYGQKMDFQAGISECETAVRLNPNFATAHHELGFILVSAARYIEAISSFDKAIALSPNDPSRWNFYLMKGIALFGLERFEDAAVLFKDAMRQRPTAFWPLLNLAGVMHALDRSDEARALVAQAIELKPDLNVRFVNRLLEGFENPPPHLTRWIADLPNLGLPD